MPVHPPLNTRGILAGDGAQLVRAAVHQGPVPQRPPDDLADVLRPLRAGDGTVVDWTLVASSATPGSTAQALAYQRWRSTFLLERFVGERSFIRSFLTWADARTDVSALQVLRHGAGHVDYPAPNTIRWQAARALDACDDAPDSGIGLYTSGDAHGPARGILVPGDRIDVLGDDQTMISAHASTLSIHHSNTSVGGTVQPVTGWDIHADHTVVHGQEQDVIVDEGTAHLLNRVGRGAPSITVRPVPVRTLAAPMLIFLRDIAEIAAKNRTALYFRSP